MFRNVLIYHIYNIFLDEYTSGLLIDYDDLLRILCIVPHKNLNEIHIYQYYRFFQFLITKTANFIIKYCN